MALIKICPTCDTKNDSSRMFCIRCMSNISSTVAIDDGSTKRDIILLLGPNNTQLEISHGDVLGREEIGSNIFVNDSSISRYHVAFAFRDNRWLIKDRGSAYGTYLNGEKIDGAKWQTINDGDKISISDNFSFIVKI